MSAESVWWEPNFLFLFDLSQRGVGLPDYKVAQQLANLGFGNSFLGSSLGLVVMGTSQQTIWGDLSIHPVVDLDSASPRFNRHFGA